MFLTLHIVLERMMVEGLVDVFQTVKNLRIQRPAMVQTLVCPSPNPPASSNVCCCCCLFQEQYHLCYDSAVTYYQSSEFLPVLPQQTRQRSSSQRGSRHGSHSSADSRKKSKNMSPSLSPARSVSQRNTPMRSDSFKESPRGTMELVASGGGASGGGAQVYGGSDATSTFGSHMPQDVPVESTSNQPAVQVHSDGLNHVASASSPASAGLAFSGSNTPQLAASTAYGSSAPVLAASAPNVAVNGVHTPVLASGPNAAPSGSHTPVLGLQHAPAPNGSSTPVSAYGPHTPVLAASYTSNVSPAPQTPAVVNHTIAPSPHTLAARNEDSFLVPGTSPGPTGHQSQSPIPAGLDMTPQVFAGSQSSMFTGSGFGSQTLSLFSGSQTPPMSHVSLSPNSQNGPPSHTNTHYHQLLETQRHAPNNSLPDRAVGAESTPL